MNPPINPETEINFLFPDQIIAIQSRKITQLQRECDEHWEQWYALKDKYQQVEDALARWRNAFITLGCFMIIIGLIWLLGPLS